MFFSVNPALICVNGSLDNVGIAEAQVCDPFNWGSYEVVADKYVQAAMVRAVLPNYRLYLLRQAR